MPRGENQCLFCSTHDSQFCFVAHVIPHAWCTAGTMGQCPVDGAAFADNLIHVCVGHIAARILLRALLSWKATSGTLCCAMAPSCPVLRVWPGLRCQCRRATGRRSTLISAGARTPSARVRVRPLLDGFEPRCRPFADALCRWMGSLWSRDCPLYDQVYVGG